MNSVNPIHHNNAYYTKCRICDPKSATDEFCKHEICSDCGKIIDGTFAYSNYNFDLTFKNKEEFYTVLKYFDNLITIKNKLSIIDRIIKENPRLKYRLKYFYIVLGVIFSLIPFSIIISIITSSILIYILLSLSVLSIICAILYLKSIYDRNNIKKVTSDNNLIIDVMIQEKNANALHVNNLLHQHLSHNLKLIIPNLMAFCSNALEYEVHLKDSLLLIDKILYLYGDNWNSYIFAHNINLSEFRKSQLINIFSKNWEFCPIFDLSDYKFSASMNEKEKDSFTKILVKPHADYLMDLNISEVNSKESEMLELDKSTYDYFEKLSHKYIFLKGLKNKIDEKMKSIAVTFDFKNDYIAIFNLHSRYLDLLIRTKNDTIIKEIIFEHFNIVGGRILSCISITSDIIKDSLKEFYIRYKEHIDKNPKVEIGLQSKICSRYEKHFNNISPPLIQRTKEEIWGIERLPDVMPSWGISKVIKGRLHEVFESLNNISSLPNADSLGIKSIINKADINNDCQYLITYLDLLSDISNKSDNATFFKEITELTISRGSTKPCPICNGEKKIVCPGCKGSKKEVCGECDGTGKKICGNCGGSGKETCDECFGDGRVMGVHHEKNCPNCHGTGEMNCSECGGPKSAVINCQTCRGKGEISCQNCNGSGKITCICNGTGCYMHEEWNDLGGLKGILTWKYFSINDSVYKLSQINNMLMYNTKYNSGHETSNSNDEYYYLDIIEEEFGIRDGLNLEQLSLSASNKITADELNKLLKDLNEQDRIDTLRSFIVMEKTLIPSDLYDFIHFKNYYALRLDIPNKKDQYLTIYGEIKDIFYIYIAIKYIIAHNEPDSTDMKVIDEIDEPYKTDVTSNIKSIISSTNIINGIAGHSLHKIILSRMGYKRKSQKMSSVINETLNQLVEDKTLLYKNDLFYSVQQINNANISSDNQNKKAYKSLFYEAYKDLVITESERSLLDMQAKLFNISEKDKDDIEKRVKNELDANNCENTEEVVIMPKQTIKLLRQPIKDIK